MREGIPQLMLAGATLLVAAAALLRARDKTVERKTYVRIGGYVLGGVSLLLLGWGAFRGMDAMRYLSDNVAAVRDPFDLRSVRIEPAVRPSVTVTNPDELRQLAQCLREATPWSPGELPPFPAYVLTLHAGDGQHVALVHQAPEDGTIVSVLSGGRTGLVLARYRSDELGPLLARLASKYDPGQWHDQGDDRDVWSLVQPTTRPQAEIGPIPTTRPYVPAPTPGATTRPQPASAPAATPQTAPWNTPATRP